jgi:hypothetical protein
MSLAQVKAAFRHIAELRLTKLGRPQPLTAQVESKLTALDQASTAQVAWDNATAILQQLTAAVAPTDLGCCTYRTDPAGPDFMITTTKTEWQMIPGRVSFDETGPC